MTEEKKVMPVMQIAVTGETKHEKLKCIIDKLEDGVKAVFTSARFRGYLKFLSSFHDYSANNCILIAMQKPDATLVAGYGDWLKKHHRYVRSGEKAIRILAPAPYKKKTEKEVVDKHGNKSKEEVEILVPAFKIVNVFDVSQTEGEPLPDLGIPDVTIEDNVENYDSLMEALRVVSPAPISFENIPGTTQGYYHHVDRRIAIQEDMSQLYTLKTTIHEIAHAVLHAWPEDGKRPKDSPTRNTKEVQAEAVAFVVCRHYGLDTSDYSFTYVAAWSKGRDIPELKASLEIIRKTAHDLITGIDAAMGSERGRKTA